MTIPLAEYAARRERVLDDLDGAVGLVLAGEPRSAHDAFAAHAHFTYLTGVANEPGAVLVLDPAATVEARRAMLFLRPLDPEAERWSGLRPGVDAALRAATGLASIYRLPLLPRFLNDAARRARRLAALHAPAAYDRPVSADLQILRKVAERVPEVTIIDRADVIPRLRSVKSDAELAMIRHAIEITAAAFGEAMRGIRPGLNEFAVQELIEHGYRTRGSRHTAFATIVGSGLNSTVLHYEANDQTIAAGDLICIDSGATSGGYRADITRTLPASGTFTDRQREVYEVVLRAQEAAIEATTPGARLAEIDTVARTIIGDAGYGDGFIHSIGHHLGLETHDAAPDEPLRPGAVVTIEPGIYLPDERIGIRIEDDILVTDDGPENLSHDIPKEPDDVERAMAASAPLSTG